jgi:hypothetical protein
MLCRIAHIHLNFRRHLKLGELRSWRPNGSEQFRSAIVFGLSDHEGRDEHFFSLFQVF